MTVSVLLPTFNQAAFLPAALDGLRAQTFQDFDLIVCNDGSTDGTEAMLRKIESMGMGTLVIHERLNQGAASAINFAAKAATGRYMTWVSSDNVMRPEWLATLVDAIANHGAVYSAYCRNEDGTSIDMQPGAYERGRLLESENCYFGPSFLIRREVWQEHRGGSAHDYDNWARVEEDCWSKGLTIGYVDKVLCDYNAGPWCTARARPDLYDAPMWRARAMLRRKTG